MDSYMCEELEYRYKVLSVFTQEEINILVCALGDYVIKNNDKCPYASVIYRKLLDALAEC